MKKTGFKQVYDILFAKYGVCRCPLKHETPFQLLMAVMLSAQCRDDRVNEVTPELFRRFPTPFEMAKASPEEVARIVHTLGLYRNKSRNMVACAQLLVQKFGGAVPSSMEELSSLPGVGRKSANVILGDAFGIPGFPVDTHVNRVLNQLGLVHSRVPEKIERAVNNALKPGYWINFSHVLILHGREICHAGHPECESCPLAGLCKSSGSRSR